VRRRRTRTSKLPDRLMVAGIIAGSIYLLAGLTGMHMNARIMLGVLAGGMYLGRTVRLPHLRSPITWRKGRGR
jgi:hypothetical protein